LLNPEPDLIRPNMEGTSQALDGKPVAPNLSHGKLLSHEHAPHRSRRPVELLRDLVNRKFYKLFPNEIDFFVRPATMIQTLL
jgi:hypothetical protein